MLQHSQLIERAKALRITVDDVSNLMQCNAAILKYNGIVELIVDGLPTSWINAQGQFLCDNKQLTKRAYEELQIPSPKSIIFETPDTPELKNFFKEGQQYVCKPLDSTHGIGVEMNICTLEAIDRYYQKFSYLNTFFLLEEQMTGKDLRIYVIDGKIVAACIREPAFVIGNGQDTLEALIEAHRGVMKRQDSKTYLEIDATTEALLAKQQLSLSDVPENERKVQLKYVANIAQGGIAIDVSDAIHPAYQGWVTALSNYLGAGYMGLDFITTDYQKPPISHSFILEVNARADWLHHTFSEHKTHDIAGIILEKVFGS